MLWISVFAFGVTIVRSDPCQVQMSFKSQFVLNVFLENSILQEEYVSGVFHNRALTLFCQLRIYKEFYS